MRLPRAHYRCRRWLEQELHPVTPLDYLALVVDRTDHDISRPMLDEVLDWLEERGAIYRLGRHIWRRGRAGTPLHLHLAPDRTKHSRPAVRARRSAMGDVASR